MSSTSTTNTTGNVPSGSSGESQVVPTSVMSSVTGEFNVGGVSTVTVKSDQAPPPALDPGTIDSVLTRDFLISTVVVNGTETLNANLLGAFDPLSKIFLNPLVWNVVKPFSFFRGGIRIRAIITPPGSCFGAMVLSALCEGGLDFTPSATVNNNLIDDLAVDTMFTAVNDTFRIINFEQASAVEFELPFEYFNNYAPVTQSPLWMWRLQLQSLVPIQSTVSTTAVATIHIYASILPGFSLGVAHYQMKKNVTGLEGFKKSKKKLQDRVSGALGGHKVSDLASSVSSLASQAAGTIPFLAPYAAPLAAGAAAVSSFAAWMGFTREATFSAPDPIVNRLFSSLALVDGVDSGEKIVMTSGAVLSIDPATGGGEHEDPMCFESIRQRWGIVSYFDLTTSSAAGTVLHNLPVCPLYGGIMLGAFFPCPGGYYGLPAQGWRGGMEYLIYIPSSSNMRGLLQIAYNPVVRTVAMPVAGVDPTGEVNTVSLDLSGTQQRIIEVPYCSPEPYKNNECMCDGKYGNRSYPNCNGSLDFYLSSAWVAPRSGVVTTRVFILARPMADMKFVRPRVAFESPTSPSSMIQVFYQSGSVDDSVELFESNILSQPLSEDFNLELSCATESFPSARALCQKFAPIWVTADTSLQWLGALYPQPSILGGGKTWGSHGTVPINAPYWNWMMHYAMLFVGIKGGVRWKRVLVGIPPDFVGTVPPSVNLSAIQYRNIPAEVGIAITILGKTHTGIQTLSTYNAVEFTFPYTNPRLYQNPRECYSTYCVDNTSGEYNRDRSVVGMGGDLSSNVTDAWPAVLYVAGADDFSVTRFRRVPKLFGAFLLPST